MIISHSKKFIFLAIPKTGTTSIEKILEIYNEEKDIPKHATLGEIHTYCKRDLRDYFVFCFVRNPWDRLVSFYHQLRQEPLGPYINPGRMVLWEYCNQNSFEKYIYYLLEKPSENLSILNKIDSKNSKLSLDFTGRFENLQDDFNIVCDTIKIPREKLPHKNIMLGKKHYSQYYNSETREIVGEMLKEEITQFGYKFEKQKNIIRIYTLLVDKMQKKIENLW